MGSHGALASPARTPAATTDRRRLRQKTQLQTISPSATAVTAVVRAEDMQHDAEDAEVSVTHVTPNRRIVRKSAPADASPIAATAATSSVAWQHPCVPVKRDHYSKRNINVPPWPAPQSLDKAAVSQAKTRGMTALAIAGITLNDSQRDHVTKGYGRKDHWASLCVYVGSRSTHFNTLAFTTVAVAHC